METETLEWLALSDVPSHIKPVDGCLVIQLRFILTLNVNMAHLIPTWEGIGGI